MYVTVTRPDFDAATFLGSIALQYGINYAQSKNFIVDDLLGSSANRAKVLDSLTRTDPIWFFGVGHGNENIFSGQNVEYIFWTCDCNQLKERVVYLLSCITGAGLGPDMVNNKGATSYIGYKDVYGWIQDVFQDPLNDKYGKGFFEPVLEVINRLADGRTTGEAYKASMDKWNQWIDYWSRSPDIYAPVVLQWMIHDRDCQVLVGSEEARVIRVAPPIPLYVVASIMVTIGFVAVNLLGRQPRGEGIVV